MALEQTTKNLLDKKAKDNNTIDLDAYNSGLEDMYNELKGKQWYSFCSRHQIYDKDCKMCHSGTWERELKELI